MTNRQRLENQTGHGATPDHAGKEAPKLIRHTILFVLVAFALGTCSGEGSQGEPTDSSTTANSVATATTTAAATTTLPALTSTTVAETTTTTGPAAPVVRGPSAYVIGTEDCKIIGMEVPLTETRPEPGVQKGRDGVFVCTVTNNDPRVAGTARYTLNQNRWGTGPQNGNMVQWGTIHIQNEHGAWDADYLGIYTSETGDVGATVFTGSGDYEGLSYYRWSISYGQSWETQGVIFPNIQDP